ncbi:hypothetical protein E1B28_013381 [Marasmius oreades]|uniref:NTF2 domain-containing protein n=1 Tax=Marasmius oreades TaxID=181124 RepID=A0A9P7RQA6_9AGAR|nr:uncharacterized protein E1B28_013381 [Marasmius oreades]KAG7087413.1 hypothetical protein E1B28_013381 [Marasmius oreades]
MTSNIVLPPADTWAQRHLSALIQASSQEDFNSAFDLFISHDVKEIILNGDKVTREEYKQKFRSQVFDERAATVTFAGTVASGKDALLSGGTGNIGIFYTAKYFEGIVIRDAPVEVDAKSSINLVVEHDPSLKPPSLPGHGGFFDGRRVFKLNQVLVDARPPVAGVTSQA